MCGIVGMITTNGKSVVDKRKYMEQALIIDTLRGEDSTGVFYQGLESIGTAGYYKQVADGYTFVNSDDYVKLAQDMDKYWFMVGHNRAATVGAVNVEGAHPFQEGAITMVHNGTLRSTYHLPKTQEQLGVAVDSHALCHNLAIMDPEDAHEVFNIIDGAFTLVWHDARDGSLNIIRNSERPLHFAQSRLDDVLYFASEAGQLQWLDTRLKLGLNEICYPEPGLHLKFMRDSLEPKAVKHTLTPKYHYGTGYSQGSGGYDRAYQQWWEEDEVEGWTSNGVPLGKQEPRQDNRVHVGGRKREIPQRLQEMLLNEDLLIEDRLLFTPMAKHVRKENHAFVVGHLDSLGITALIHKVEANTANAAFDRRWLVRPVGVKYADRDRSTPIIICKLVSTATVDSAERIAAATPTPQQSTDDLPDVYPIGDNTWTGRQEWLELTAEGCTYCDAVLHLHDAEKITWLEDEMALCPTCSEDAWIMDQDGRELPWLD